MNYEWKPFNKCPDCDEMIQAGIKFMIDHQVEKHGLQERTNTLINARTLKGSELTIDEALTVIGKNEHRK